MSVSVTPASVTLQGSDVLALAGVLDYRSGPGLREQGRRLIEGAAPDALVVDCSAVEKSSSVGLSLLLAFSRDAKARGKALSVRALPEDLAQIAQVYGIGTLLNRS